MPSIRPLFRLLLAGAVLALPACSDSTGAKAGPAAHLDAVGGNTQTAAVNTELPQPVVVKVTDAKGHAVKGQVVNFVVTAGGGHVFAGTALTNDDGIAQERWTLGAVAGPQTLEARAVDSSTGQALVFATFTATATAGPPVQVEPTGASGASAASGDTVVIGVVGSVVEDSFAVLVHDAAGNPVPGAQVAWTVTSGGGSITSPTTADAAGVARTQWVLGASAGPQTAQATVGGATVRFTAYPADQLVIDAGNGQTGGPGLAVAVRVGAKSSVTGGIPGLPIHWTVASGGGSVAPAVVKTVNDPNGRGLGIASAQWTLGAPGPQTLTASAGALSVTFTATALAAGTRTLLVQLPAGGGALDATAGRVLWIDGATRVVRVRTVSSGADATVKVDSVKNGDPSTWRVAGHLYTGGALVWNYFGELFDWHGGTTAYLGHILNSQPPSVDGDWASYFLEGTGLFRRNLAAATAELISNTSTLSDVGPDGTLVYWGAGSSLVTVPPSGAPSSKPIQGNPCSSYEQVFTDGVNAAYYSCTFTTSLTAWLSKAGGDEVLTGVNFAHGDHPYLLLSGGWAAYGATGAVTRRAPDGTKVQLAGSGAVLHALSPAGAVVYALGGQFYKVAPNGTTAGAGPALQGERVVWGGDRFLLLSGSSVYDLGS